MQKISLIQKVLDHYFPEPPVPLNNSNDFTFLVAVVLSAQTTDGKVNEVTETLFKHASTPEAMSKLDPTFVEGIIRSVGLAPTKAKNIVKLSQKLVSDFNSLVPSSYEELESLPGVGHKTASVIMSQLFGQPAFAVDTHVHRLALRWNLTKEEKNVGKAQADLCKCFPEESWNKVHLQMIYFGREFCTAKDHENKFCPICCWIHKTDLSILNPLDQISKFESKKRSKGIVYYSDRVVELDKEPSLAFHSPFKGSGVKQEVIIKEELNIVKTALKLDDEEIICTRVTRSKIKRESIVGSDSKDVKRSKINKR